jgi:hypothetical protein
MWDVPRSDRYDGDAISKFLGPVAILAAVLFTACAVCAQSIDSDGSAATGEPTLIAAEASLTLPSPIIPNRPVKDPAASIYVRPTQQQKFRNYAWNAVGPVALAGASFAGAIDQGFNFPKAWHQGMGAYGQRVASNLGISAVTATAQYSIGEVFHEDTAYYRCQCNGLVHRFVHAAYSSVASRRGSDGHMAFSPALTIAPFIGPMIAANTWIPSHNGPTLGFHMGEHNLMGQFAQNEGLEFVYGGPNTILGKLQRRFLKK